LSCARDSKAGQYFYVDKQREQHYIASDCLVTKTRSDMNNQEVMEFTDKVVRDGAYRDLRLNGDELERQVVRFSGCEKIGEQEVILTDHGLKGAKIEFQSIYRSTWSLAYPRS
jgi:hypothetical protein